MVDGRIITIETWSLASDQVSIVMIRPSTIAVVSEISGESFTVQPHRLSSVEF